MNDDDITDMLNTAADMYEATWVSPLREFLTAGTSQAAVRVLGKHPQLRSPRAASLIDKFIREAGEQNDMVGQRHCGNAAGYWAAEPKKQRKRISYNGLYSHI